jgi:hypothetical protein
VSVSFNKTGEVSIKTLYCSFKVNLKTETKLLQFKKETNANANNVLKFVPFVT